MGNHQQKNQLKECVTTHPVIASWMSWVIVGVCLFWWPAHVSFHADEGYIAEMSARVLRGEIPNIDFATNYWGLMYYVNAFLFKLFGKNLLTLRLEMVFLISAIFLPCIYWILRNWMNRWWSILGTLFASALSICISISIHGNWMAVFLCLPAITLLLNTYPNLTKINKDQKTKLLTKTNTLVAIGILLGLAFLMKHTIAVYTGFAVVQGLFYHHLYHSGSNAAVLKKPSISWVLVWLLLQSVILLILYFILSTQFNTAKFLFYFLSPIVISLFSVINAFKLDNEHFKKHLKSVTIVVISGLLPIGLYLVPYALRGQLETLLTEILVHYPKLYLTYASVDFIQHIKPSVVFGFGSILITLILFYKHKKWMILAGVMSLFIIGSQLLKTPYLLTDLINRSFFVLIQWVIWGTLASVLYFTFNYFKTKNSQHAQTKALSNTNEKSFFMDWKLLTLLAWGSYMTMNLFPLGVLNYVGYSLLPFALVTVIGLHYLTLKKSAGSSSIPFISELPVVIFLSFWVLFGYCFTYHQLGLIDPGEPIFPYQIFSKTMPSNQGGHIQINTVLYNRLTPMLDFIKDESKRNDDVFLFSDQPVIYFLSNQVNPTRYSYAIDSNLTDGRHVIKGLEEHKTTYVLLELNQFQYNQAKLKQYLMEHYKPYRELESHILVFKRREN